MFNERQKKIITITLLVLLSIIFIAGLIVSIVLISIGKVEAGAIISTITNFISPTTIVGIVIKFIMNKYFNKKNVRDTKIATIEILEDSGVKVPNKHKQLNKPHKNELDKQKKVEESKYGYV